MEPLERALTANRAEVEIELAKAEAELTDLRGRAAALERVIGRARSALGVASAPASEVPRTGRPTEKRIPLHDVLVRILREGGNSPRTAQELADEVNRTALYRTRNGSDVDVGQIHARVHNYSRLFRRELGRISLHDAELAVHDPATLARFNAAMLEVYNGAMREVRYPARRFLDMTRRRGGLDAAKHLLAKPGASEGFRRLAEARKLALTMEYQVLRPEFVTLFTDEERENARQRLLNHGLLERELP